jgi:hypothetical protein
VAEAGTGPEATLEAVGLAPGVGVSGNSGMPASTQASQQLPVVLLARICDAGGEQLGPLETVPETGRSQAARAQALPGADDKMATRTIRSCTARSAIPWIAGT